MSSLIDPLQKLLGFLQNNSLLGFPYLYWAISGVVSILLCICICCCMCCRKKKRGSSNEKQLRELNASNNVPKHMVRTQSISTDITQMTTVDAATRRSMGSQQHNQEHHNYNKHQQQKQRKQQKQHNQQLQQSPYNQNNNNDDHNNRYTPKKKPERTFAGLKPEKTNYNNNNSYDNNPNHTNNQNQYGNNNNYGNSQYDNNQQHYGNNQQYDNNQQYGNSQNGNNNNWNQTQSQSQYRNDNNHQHNQYGNNNINPNEYRQPGGNEQQIEQNNQHIATNDNNSHTANKSFGIKMVPKSIYHPVSYKNVFNAKTANTNNKFSRSPQPNQSYNLRANQQNNHPSNSAPAPAPNTNQIQQQYPAPISHHGQPQNNNNINNQGYEIRKLGDGQSQRQHRNKYHKKKKNKRMKHAPAFSAIDESKLKQQQSNAPKNMKLDIQVDGFEDGAQEIKAPPKRNRNKENNNQLSPVDAGGGYGGLSAPKFRKKRGDVNPDDYSDSEERAKMSQWDARRSSVNAGTQLSTGNGVDPFKGRRRSVFDESSSDEEELGGRRLTVDMTSAKNNKVSSHMANLNRYQ